MATSPLHESFYGQCNTSNSFFLGADDESEREDLDDGVSHHFYDARRSEFSNEINTGNFSPTAAQSEISYSDSGSERYDIIKQLPDSTSVINGFFNRIQSIPDFPTAKFKIYNDYIFGACLGQGSYGKVKEVLHSQTLTRYAVKIFSYQKLRKIPRWEKIMKNELKVLKKLNHENVISLQDHFYRPEKKKTYYIFEFCVTNMQEMLSHSTEGRFPEVQARYYFLQLIKGLSYLQSVRVVHKDIKPANLLISSSHQLKIGDFGTAEVLDIFADDGICTSVEGTPQFQSPEIAKPEDTYDGYASDIWAAGVTLYNMTTGKYRFKSLN